MRRRGQLWITTIAVALVALAAGPGRAATMVGTTFPAGFPVPVDGSLKVPVIGFGSNDGTVTHRPVIFLHGNNDTPYATTCNGSFGRIHDFAQYFADHGYALKELWGLGYQGEQCDLLTTPTNKSGPAHSTIENVPDLRAFVHAVLAYTGASQVDIVGHSLGTTLAREWMRQDTAYPLVHRLVGVDGPNHGIINCSPSAQNFWQSPALGGFNPNSAICVEYGSDRSPLLSTLNGGNEAPGPTQYLMIVNADTSFVYFDRQDGDFPPVPAQDRTGAAHDFSRSARLDGGAVLEVRGQGRFDNVFGTTHLGIVNSPEVWKAALDYLLAPDPSATAPAAAASEPRVAAAAQRGALPATGGGSAALALVALATGLAVRRHAKASAMRRAKTSSASRSTPRRAKKSQTLRRSRSR